MVAGPIGPLTGTVQQDGSGLIKVLSFERSLLESEALFLNWQLETNWNGVNENLCAFVKSGTG